jgi:hypothetical protein
MSVFLLINSIRIIKIRVFWDMKPYSMINRYHHFRRTCYLHLEGRKVSLLFYSEDGHSRFL